MNIHWGILFGLVLPLFYSTATLAIPYADDSDLSSPVTIKKSLSKSFTADRTENGSSVEGLSLKFVRIVKGKETPVAGLAFKIFQNKFTTNEQGEIVSRACAGGQFSPLSVLDADRYSISGAAGIYEFQVVARCGVRQKFIVDEETEAGQALGLWQVLVKAEKKLLDHVGLEFWKRKIPVKFPSSGDFYSFGQLNITKGFQWDVVAHELGHAIYDQARIGGFGGGSHKIDECYSEILALSEGWASFFAAWVSLDLSDTDAKFEYMVPRRAPIQVENVPVDVCGKVESEWRVFAFLWDLIDLHRDSEQTNETFRRLWDATLNKKFQSIVDIKKELLSRGWSKAEIEIVWKLNFPADLQSRRD